MITFLVQSPNIPFNPEAIINATVAAKAAELAANQSFYISLGAFGVLLIIGAILMFILYKAAELEHNTDGMRIQLVEATRKLALLEGNKIGRAEQTQEQDAAPASEPAVK